MRGIFNKYTIRSNVPIKLVKLKIALNVLLYVKPPIVSPIAKLPSLNVKLFVKNPNVTGNAINLNALNLSVS